MLAIVLGFFCFFSSTETSGFPFSDKLLSDETFRLEQHNQTDTSGIIAPAGRYLTINRIFITGNRLTLDKIILRELSVKSGDPVYSEDLPAILERDRNKLINTRLFNTVEIRTLELEQGRIDLLIDLAERWYTFPAPIFELSDRNFNEWWQNYDHDFRRVNYGLRLYQYNMRGRNETLRLTAQLGFQRAFNLSYQFPYIDQKQKHGLVITADYLETKNLAYRTFGHKLEFVKGEGLLRVTRGAGVAYTYRNSFYDIHSFKIEHRRSDINDTIAVLNPNYFGEGKLSQEYTTISYAYSHDHRDLVAYPLSGHYFLATIQKTGLGIRDEINKTEGSLSYARFIDLTKGLYFSTYFSGYWSFPEEIPYAFYNAIGYRRLFLRGYEVYLIEGSNFIVNKTTLKKRIFSNIYRFNFPIEQFRRVPIDIYFKIYGDLGYAKNYPGYDINDQLSDILLTGVGAGFDVVTFYDAVVRFEYSINREGQKGFFFNVKKEF